MIRVQLLGRFRMYDETRCLNEEAIHSPMITKLLVYMICNKNHIVTLEQLTEALWTDEKSENPYGALKNMMYRLRGTLLRACKRSCYFINTNKTYDGELNATDYRNTTRGLCRRKARCDRSRRR